MSLILTFDLLNYRGLLLLMINHHPQMEDLSLDLGQRVPELKIRNEIPAARQCGHIIHLF